MPYYKINDRDMRFTEAKSLVGASISSGTNGVSGSTQILNTPGYSPSCPAINIGTSNPRGALERIPGTEGFIQSLAGFTPIYPGGRYSALHPYDEVRFPQRFSLQSSSFLSPDVSQTSEAQYREHIQNVWMPEYTSKYGPRYDNAVENKQTILLSRPVMAPAWGFDSTRGTNYNLSTGFSSFAWVNVRQDDIGESDPVSSYSVTGTAADIKFSKGLSPVLTVLSASWNNFTTGSSISNSNTLGGLTPPYVCFSWGIHRDDNGDRRIYLMAATGTSQNDVYVTQSSPVSINLEEWNHIGIRWQQDINNRTGSFVINNNVVGEFVLDESQIFTPNDSNSKIFPTSLTTSTFHNKIINPSVGFGSDDVNSSLDGIITIGNLGNQRFSGDCTSQKSMPLVSGSAKLLELHDIALWNSFVELEYIEPYWSGSVEFNNSDFKPVFYVPVATPYAGKLKAAPGFPVYEKSMWEGSISSQFINPLGYYGTVGPSNFFTNQLEEIPLEEAHFLSVAQLGSNLGNSSLGMSTIDKLAVGGTIPGSMFENINDSEFQGVGLFQGKSPVLGLGGAFMISCNLIDVVSLNPSMYAQVASGTIHGQNRISAIPFCPMDYIIGNTSSSFGYSCQRVWPSNHHSFDFNANKINTWIENSGSSNSILTGFYTEKSWGYRQRIKAASTRKLINVNPMTVTYSTNSGSQVLDPLFGRRTKIDHFANTAFNLNTAWYIPKVIAGDNIDKGTIEVKIIPSIYDNISGFEISRFGSFATSPLNDHGEIEPELFTLDFIDNGYGGLVRSPFISPAPNEQFIIFYDRGTIVQKHPSLFWAGQPVYNENRQFWTINLTSSNKVFIREVEMTIPKNKATIPFSPNSKTGTVTGADIYDKSGNLIEKVRLGQPIERLSGSAITIRTFTVF